MAQMVDITLQTNCDNPSLTLRACHRLGSDFGCVLSVRSGPFAAEIDFYFEGYALEIFIADLQTIDSSLQGRARLKLEFEEPFIELEGDGLGHVSVRGLLLQTGPSTQKLEFTFSTDQTCLRPFIQDLQLLESENAI
jgi:hypothetical protein